MDHIMLLCVNYTIAGAPSGSMFTIKFDVLHGLQALNEGSDTIVYEFMWQQWMAVAVLFCLIAPLTVFVFWLYDLSFGIMVKSLPTGYFSRRHCPGD